MPLVCYRLTFWLCIPYYPIIWKKGNLLCMIEQVFKSEEMLHFDNKAFSLLQNWTLQTIDGINYDFLRMFEISSYLIQNTDIRFGTKIIWRNCLNSDGYKLMGTNCAPNIAASFVFCNERYFMTSLSDNNHAGIIEEFDSISRYLDHLSFFEGVFILISIFGSDCIWSWSLLTFYFSNQ